MEDGWTDLTKFGKCDWSPDIPEGFSCGVAALPKEGCTGDRFLPVDCSEVVLKVANPRHCKNCKYDYDRQGELKQLECERPYGDDCIDKLKWD